VSPLLLAAATPVAIPTQSVESLNAAIAAAIILYESGRRAQRP
jgi:tRNA G18 (ribose-2'-O)-methylase SpoU